MIKVVGKKYFHGRRAGKKSLSGRAIIETYMAQRYMMR